MTARNRQSSGGISRGAFGDIHGILLRSVANHPRRAALEAGGRVWTFSQLAEAVDRATFQINSALDNRKTRLGLIGGNHPAYIIGFLAAQKLGVATVEVNPEERFETLRDIVERTDCGLVLTDREALMPLGGEDREVCLFDDFLEGRNGQEMMTLPEKVDRPLPASQVASIVFTSGTTGRPLGVELSQGNFDYVTSAVIDYLGLRSEDRYALILPLHHTYGKSVLLSSLGSGACLIMIDSFQNMPVFLRSLRGHGCSVISALPAHLQMLRKHMPAGIQLPELRTLTTSGGHLPPETAFWLHEQMPKLRIYSMYGLTEATTRATFLSPDALLTAPESCGYPLPGVEMAIVDPEGRSVPPGVAGEVVLRGPNVMHGYFDEPELTAEALRDGWLHTGDVGRLNLRGQLYLSGRCNEIIKCAGERISMREIETIIEAHPDVARAAVVARPHEIKGEVPHAFVEPGEGKLDLDELKIFCTRLLSRHKLPRAWNVVDSLPRTATGKIRKFMLEAGD